MTNKQRVVVITGGGSGMGRAMARRFAVSGDQVYVLGRHLAKLQETARGFKNISCLKADVTDIKSIRTALSKILNSHKTVDVLVNNAGGAFRVAPDAPFKQIIESWEATIKTNLTSVFYMIQAFGPHLTRPGGRIINITSTAALGGSRQGGPGGQAYAASKAGIHGLSRTLAPILGPEGITINCVAPGVIPDTQFFGPKGMPQELRDAWLPITPVKRLGTPEEVAEGVFYIASEKSGFVTGEILNINGGAQYGR